MGGKITVKIERRGELLGYLEIDDETDSWEEDSPELSRGKHAYRCKYISVPALKSRTVTVFAHPRRPIHKLVGLCLGKVELDLLEVTSDGVIG
jgi:hypothetical protein